MGKASTLHRSAIALGLLVALLVGGMSIFTVRSLPAAVTSDTKSTSSKKAANSSAKKTGASASGKKAAGTASSKKKPKPSPFFLLRPHCTADDQLTCTPFNTTSPKTMETDTMNVGDTLDVDLILQNGPSDAIQSVRAWLQYDPAVLEGTNIIIGDTFPTTTPGEANFDADRGYAMIQAGSETPSTDPTINVAELTFTVKSIPVGGRSVLSFYDQGSDTPHTAVYNGSSTQQNLLTTAPASLTIIMEGAPTGSEQSAASSDTSSSESVPVDPLPVEASSESVAAAENDSTSSSEAVSSEQAAESSDASSLLGDATSSEQVEPAPDAASSQSSLHQAPSSASGSTHAAGRSVFVLLQVQNLRITTEGSSLYVAWDPLASPVLQGYNIYYGTQPGRYIQRRTVRPEETSTAVRSLVEGTTYYVAIRGLGNSGEETAFSQEVAVKIGNPRTSTAPLYLKSTDQGPQGENPLEAHTSTSTTVPGESGLPSTVTLLLAASAAIGMLFAFRRQLSIPSHTSHV